MTSRSPHGERGLKLDIWQGLGATLLSLPARGAWIEILCKRNSKKPSVSLPARGAWIEISILMTA